MEFALSSTVTGMSMDGELSRIGSRRLQQGCWSEAGCQSAPPGSVLWARGAVGAPLGETRTQAVNETTGSRMGRITTTTDVCAPLGEEESLGGAALVRFFPYLSHHTMCDADRVTLGRGSGAGIAVEDGRVSRTHAHVDITPTGVVVHDCASHNGSFLNGERLRGARNLEEGDVLRLGRTLFVYRDCARPFEAQVHGVAGYHGLVGPVGLRDAIEALERAASHGLNVLLLGETGTGKEVAAQAYAEAARPGRPFVKLNVAALPREMLASGLFGHRKGAFTGAAESRLGAFREAHGGVLLLDELGAIDPAHFFTMQRALQEGEVQPIGSDRVHQVDVRVVGATQHALDELVRDGAFEASIYNRIRQEEVRLPPLRERVEDLPSLVAHLLERIAGFAHDPSALDARGLELLARHPFVHNVRELEHILRSAHDSRDGESGPSASHLRASMSRWSAPAVAPVSAQRPKLSVLQLAEADAIEEALRSSHGSVCEAARRLSIHRATLYRKLQQHALQDLPALLRKARLSGES